MRLLQNSAFPLYLNGEHKGDFFLVFNYNGFDEPRGDDLSVCAKPTRTRYGYQCYHHSGTSNALNEVRVNASGWASALKAGAKIQKGDRFSTSNGQVNMAEATWQSFTSRTRWYGPWANKGRGVANRYLGLEFRFGGAFHFGWARLTVGRAARGFTATLTGYAYETIPGKGIVAGQIHDGGKRNENNFESGASLGGMALGAAGQASAIHGN